MKHIATALVIAAAGCVAWASEPGQPLDCSDWVFLEPGYSCEYFGSSQDGTAHPNFGANAQFDNQGRFFRVVPRIAIGSCGNYARYRTRLEWLDEGTWRPLAYVDNRCIGGPAPETMDCIEPGGSQGNTGDTPAVLAFDAINGRMLVNLVSTCESCPAESDYTVYWFASIRGFATTFDVLQTFTPAASALGFRVPYMPEGMPAADHFDTYWGALAHPIDFSQAHGLSCDYPATPPAVGDYLEVPATLPDPPPGQGYWYLTSATYQGQSRFGRKTSGGRLSGRDPGLFPNCVASDRPSRDSRVRVPVPAFPIPAAGATAPARRRTEV